jgi:hypothetical protein
MAQTDPNANPFDSQMLNKVQGYPGINGSVSGVNGAGTPGAPGYGNEQGSGDTSWQNPTTTSAAPQNMPAGIDPALAAIYQGSGLDPSGRGSGFADWQYWQGVGPSQYGRLKADIAGTGTDQSTGTPGSGSWSRSGVGANSGPSGQSSFNMSSGSGIDSTKTNALFDQLMQRANTSLNVNPNDPIIKAQTDAYGAQTQNAEKNYEAQAAEKGGANYNPDATARSMAEQGGQAQGAFQAQLMGQELQARRGEVEQALAEAVQLGETDKQQMLQEELAKLQLAQNADFQKQNIGQQAYQFDQTNALNNSPLVGA